MICHIKEHLTWGWVKISILMILMGFHWKTFQRLWRKLNLGPVKSCQKFEKIFYINILRNIISLYIISKALVSRDGHRLSG